MNFALAVPTLNAGSFAEIFISSVNSQTALPATMVVIDSSSVDETATRFRTAGVDVVTIARSDFDHGATRQMAVRHLIDIPIVIFLTQDAIPAERTAFASLIAAFDDETVAAAYGRQLPREGADVAEAHARIYNYPADSSVKALADSPRFGIKTPFMSNSFAAYRVSALTEVGGFPSSTLFGEDMYVAAKLLLEGYRIAYVAEATVVHSHQYSVGDEFRRYFDVGAFHARNPWIMQKFGPAGREGLAYVRSELCYARKVAPTAIPGLLVRNALKLLGMRIGQKERMLPRAVKRRISMNPGFWDRDPL